MISSKLRRQIPNVGYFGKKFLCSNTTSNQPPNGNGKINVKLLAATTTLATAGALLTFFVKNETYDFSTLKAYIEKNHIEKNPRTTTLVSNWSDSHRCEVSNFYEPESLKEVSELVKLHHQNKKKLRPIGSGCSPNGLAFLSNDDKETNSVINLAHCDAILSVDQQTKQVTIESGVIVGNLLETLRTKYNLTLQNVASIREQQFGGVTQAGCHGTGVFIPPIEEQIVSMEIVTPAKGKMTLSATENPELFSLAKCGLGALGVVTKLTIQCVDAHKLIEKTSIMNVEQLKENHVRMMNENQHLRYMWLPRTEKIVVVECKRLVENEVNPFLQDMHKILKQNNRTTVNAVAASAFTDEEKMRPVRELYREMWQQFYPNLPFDETDCKSWSFTKFRDELLKFNPIDVNHTIQVNQVEQEYWSRCQGYRIGYSDEIIGFDCGGQQLVLEVAFPCNYSVDALNKKLSLPTGSDKFVDIEFVEKLIKKIELNGEIPSPAPIEQRWTSASSAGMSPVCNQKNPAVKSFSWVGVVLYLCTQDESERMKIKQTFKEYSDLLVNVMEPFEGLEHWAKLELPSTNKEKQLLQERLKKHYPIDQFRKWRNLLDPHHILSNQIVDIILREDH